MGRLQLSLPCFAKVLLRVVMERAVLQFEVNLYRANGRGGFGSQTAAHPPLVTPAEPLKSRPWVLLGGRKTAQEKKQIPGNGGSQELFGPMFPWVCLFSLSFQWEEGQKFPGTLFLGTFFSYFRWFFSFRTVTASHKMLTLQAPSSFLNAGTARRGCLGRGEVFRCPPAACPPERPRPFAHSRVKRAVERTPRGSCNRTLLRRVLRRFSNSKRFLEGFLERACKGFSVKTRFLEGFLEGSFS